MDGLEDEEEVEDEELEDEEVEMEDEEVDDEEDVSDEVSFTFECRLILIWWPSISILSSLTISKFMYLYRSRLSAMLVL